MKILVTILLVTVLLSLTLGGLVFGGPAWMPAPGGCDGSWDVESGVAPPTSMFCMSPISKWIHSYDSH